MKHTFLELVQKVLNDINGDQVNSWTDTVESEQVGYIIEQVCEDMWSNRDWDYLRRLVDFQASGTTDRPTHVTLPDNIKRIVSINYNIAKLGDARLLYSDIKYICPDDFLRLSNGRNSTDSNTDTIIDPSGVRLLITRNAHPRYYTSFNDQEIVFDSYDVSIEDTIEESRLQALAYIIPDFVKQDSYIPELPKEAFSALIQESISRASLKLNSTADPKAEQESRRQQRWLANNAWRVNDKIETENYGRCTPRAPVRRRGYW